MFKRLHNPKGKQMYGLLTLLAIAVAVMVVMYKSSHSHVNHMGQPFVPGSGDTLNIAIEMNPSIYRVKGDSVSGRDYEMLMQISERFGVPMKFYPFVPLSHAMEGLDRGTFDIVVASLPLVTKLRQRYLMTEPVYLDREILVQRSDSTHTPIKNQIELGGDTVWITEDSPFRWRLEHLSEEIGDTIHILSSPEYSAEALLILTARGIIKYAVINEGIARQLKPNYDNIDITTPISFTQFQSWALHQGDSTLCDSINSWIKIINKR